MSMAGMHKGMDDDRFLPFLDMIRILNFLQANQHPSPLYLFDAAKMLMMQMMQARQDSTRLSMMQQKRLNPFWEHRYLWMPLVWGRLHIE